MTNTYMEIVEADDANPNTIKEPAKRWRNWWLALEDYILLESGEIRRKGDVGPGAYVFPSKEVAEEKALESVAYNEKSPDGTLCKYLGAFPEGERP